MTVSRLLSQCNRSMWVMAGILSSLSWRDKEDQETRRFRNDEPVKVAHSHNFNKMVIESGREALILFYSPSCIYCKRIAPVWEELGEKLQNEDVDIVKIDASVNRWPRSVYRLDGVPTIYWKYASQPHKPIKYEGGRAVDDFIRYVSEMAPKELDGWDRMGRPK